MSSKQKIALYPGTFDPVTNGHLDVLSRALNMFDKIVVAVAANTGKSPMFDLDTRVALIKENVSYDPRISVEAFDVLTVNLAASLGAVAIIRGLRAVSDFEFEFQLAQMNRHLDSKVETVFLMPSHKYFYTSSTIIKQVAYYDPSKLGAFVPKNVQRLLKSRCGR